MSDELRVVKAAAARLRDGNPEPRVPCVLLLDVSGSMSGDKIHELNAGLETIRTELLKDEQAARRVELAVVTFGGKVEVAQDFALPSEFKPPVLVADGDTPMGTAILRAYELVEKRKARYEASDLDSYEPWVFMVTDGVSTDPPEVRPARSKRSERTRASRTANGSRSSPWASKGRRCRSSPRSRSGPQSNSEDSASATCSAG